jgi:DNA polymerase III epsilon subunit-like protein
MPILILDTETSGLPFTRIISPDDLHLWPHIMQFSYIIYDVDHAQQILQKDYIIHLDEEVEISSESIKLHNITKEISQDSPYFIGNVLMEFFNDIQQYNVKTIIGHNVAFDMNMVKVELLRLIFAQHEEEQEMKLHVFDITYTLKSFCTMQKSLKLSPSQVKTQGWIKYPKLQELHCRLFGEIPIHLHNSLHDVLVTLRCYYQMQFHKDLIALDENFKIAISKCLVSLSGT